MTASITAGELQSGLALLRDASIALLAGLKNLPADEAVVVDGLEIAAPFVPGLAPVILAAPAAEFVLNWIVANNTQGRPDSITPMPNAGSRGGASPLSGGRIDPMETAGLEDAP